MAQQSDIDRMVMSAHYVNALDMESRLNEPLDNMEREAYQERIRLLEESLETYKKMYSEFKALAEQLSRQLEAQERRNRELEKQLQILTDRISELTALLSASQAEADKYKSRTIRSNQDKYNTTSKKSKALAGERKCRQQEKDETDTAYDINDEEGGNAESVSVDESMVTKEDVTKERGPRGHYTLMDAAKVVSHESLKPLLPKGWTYLKEPREIRKYTRVSYIQCDRFIVYVAKDMDGKRHDIYVPADPSDKELPYENVISGTHCTPEFMASLITDRFQLHLPVFRQMTRLANEKMQICEQTVSNWLNNGAEWLKGVTDALKSRLLKKRSILHIDETWCRVKIQMPGHPNGKYLKKYVWVIVNKMSCVAYFLYDNDEGDSRGRRPIQSFLGDFAGGIQTDAYTVYKFFCWENDLNKHALCWAHVRTRFWDAAKTAKDKVAEWFVRKIGFLYFVELENRIKRRSFKQIKERRNQKDVIKTMTEIRKKAERLLHSQGSHLSDQMERALKYMLGGWDKLQTYLNDGRFDIDNLEAERKIRPFTIGRKNSVLFGGEIGVKTASVYYTLIETCKMLGVCPQDYFTHVFREMVNGNKDAESLLPHNLMPILA